MQKLMHVIAFVFLISAAHSQDEFIIASVGSEMSQIAQVIVLQAYKDIGINASIKVLPAARSIFSSNAGIADAEVIRKKGIEAEFPNLVMVPEPVVSLDLVAVVAKGSRITLESWPSLKGYSIACRRGLLTVETATKGMDVIYVPEYINGLQLVDNERVEVTVLPKISAIKEIYKHNLRNVMILKPDIDSTPLYHYVNVKHKDIVPRLAEAISAMKESGVYKELTDKKILEIIQQ